MIADLTGPQCAPTTVHWTMDTWALAHSTGGALVKAGGTSWFFVTADYAFGLALERDTTAFVKQAGGTVIGSVKAPFPTADFSLVPAAGAVLGRQGRSACATPASDAVNSIKQAGEFGLTQAGIKLAGLLVFISDVHALGLQTAQGLNLTESFYWDLNDRTRAFTGRLIKKTDGFHPGMGQAGCYGGMIHYLKTVAAMGVAEAKKSGTATVNRMKAMPTDDDAFGAGSIRVGRAGAAPGLPVRGEDAGREQARLGTTTSWSRPRRWTRRSVRWPMAAARWCTLDPPAYRARRLGGRGHRRPRAGAGAGAGHQDRRAERHVGPVPGHRRPLLGRLRAPGGAGFRRPRLRGRGGQRRPRQQAGPGRHHRAPLARQDGVDVIVDVPNSSVALAVNTVVREKNKAYLNSGAGTVDLTGAQCSPNTVHWTYDVHMLAKSTGGAMVKAGGNSWFFVTADYVFGQQLASETSRFVTAAGGKVLGEARYPFPATTDFSSFLLQAQASGAKVLGLANAGADTINCIKQAAEFGLTGQMKLAALLMFISDVNGLGLQTAQGLNLTESFYWDLNDRTRALSKRLEARSPGVRANMDQAGCYAAALHYLKAVADMGVPAAKASGAAVVARMKAMPTDDDAFGRGSIREDGRGLFAS